MSAWFGLRKIQVLKQNQKPHKGNKSEIQSTTSLTEESDAAEHPFSPAPKPPSFTTKKNYSYGQQVPFCPPHHWVQLLTSLKCLERDQWPTCQCFKVPVSPHHWALLLASLRVRFLAAKGGKSTKDSVKRMFSCMFSNDLTKLCNWTGLGQKIAFKGLILKNIVHRAIRKNPGTRDATEGSLQKIASKFMKGAADRDGGRRYRQKTV
ncbi:uncharacterized protein LOC124477078 [Hypomesus transpacificus]|uniref:uncharacterized protein LOC124477078 n=1 Tax=Hypomesus transpacificus TaxID=137520 RepID=UPI001F0796BA|nr:uncharacterized protein LOC124477078 [Hypomesus transpacificus]XP_046890566.1 uncharacterized protein LOC124477078 [Hypomesus transpacificus]